METKKIQKIVITDKHLYIYSGTDLVIFDKETYFSISTLEELEKLFNETLAYRSIQKED